jgi:hypothetical protein
MNYKFENLCYLFQAAVSCIVGKEMAMNTSYSDAALVRASIAGKLSAFEALVERYHNQLRSYRRAVTAQKEMAWEPAEENLDASLIEKKTWLPFVIFFLACQNKELKRS